MKEGDEILKINGVPVRGKTVDQVADMMVSLPQTLLPNECTEDLLLQNAIAGPVDFTTRPADISEGPNLSTEVRNRTYTPFAQENRTRLARFSAIVTADESSINFTISGRS